MATGSDLYYPQLRKQAFHIKRYRGGVDDALWQHREAVAHLLGPEGMFPTAVAAYKYCCTLALLALNC